MILKHWPNQAVVMGKSRLMADVWTPDKLQSFLSLGSLKSNRVGETDGKVQ